MGRMSASQAKWLTVVSREGFIPIDAAGRFGNRGATAWSCCLEQWTVWEERDRVAGYCITDKGRSALLAYEAGDDTVQFMVPRRHAAAVKSFIEQITATPEAASAR